VAGVVAVLSLLSWLLLRSGTSVGMKAGSAWKLAMSAMRRRRRQNVLQVLVFSLTIMSLLILALLRTDLIADWQAQLPEETPNHFLMNVTGEQVEGIGEFFEANRIEPRPFYPMASAGLTAVNGETPRRPWEDDEGGGANLTERSGSGMEDDGSDAEFSEDSTDDSADEE